jgi:hypothetical protein
MPFTPDLRTWQPKDSDAKDVENTKMLNTEAHETPDTVTAVNNNEEFVSKHPPFGELGSQGRK